MKNNKIISGGLFKEGVRQLRAIGIAFSSVALLLTLYQCINYVAYAIEKAGKTGEMNWCPTVTTADGYSFIIAFFAIYALIPVMGMMIFNFLNNRSASDYYHSIPKTRLNLAASFSSSVAFWYFLPVAASVVIETVIGGICGAEIAWAEIGMYLLAMTGVFVHAYGIVLLAVSLATGILNQLAMTVIIAILPRLLLMLIGEIGSSTMPVLRGLDDVLGRFGEYDFNIIFGGIDAIDNVIDKMEFGPVIYSFVLGIIYVSLGVLAFMRRKSEASTLSGANKVVQCSIRVLVAFVVCLVPNYLLAESMIRNYGKDDSQWLWGDLPSAVLFYSIAIIAYFLYEAISARKIRGVVTLRGTMGIGLAALLILNIVFIISPVAVVKASLDRELNTSTVKSVCLSDDNRDFRLANYKGVDTVKFSEDEIIELLCDSLEHNIKLINSGKRSNLYSMESVIIRFNLNGGGTATREVYMFDYDIEKFEKELLKNEDLMKVLRDRPQNVLDKKYINIEMQTEIFSDEDRAELYELLCDELEKMSDEEYIEYLGVTATGEDNEITTIDYFNVHNWDYTSYYGSYDINHMVPKTYARYVELCNKYTWNMLNGETLVDIYRDCEYSYIEIAECGFIAESGIAFPTKISFEFVRESKDEPEDIAVCTLLEEIYSAHKNENVDVSEEMYMIQYTFSGYGEHSEMVLSGRLFVSDLDVVLE